MTFLIFLSAVIFLIVLYFVGKSFFKKYQQKKKLVPLLTDYAEYEDDLME